MVPTSCICSSNSRTSLSGSTTELEDCLRRRAKQQPTHTFPLSEPLANFHRRPQPRPRQELNLLCDEWDTLWTDIRLLFAMIESQKIVP